MGKGMIPKKGYNDKAYKDNNDKINWSSTRNKNDAKVKLKKSKNS